MSTTRTDAEQYITECLRDFAADHDITAIADQIYDENGGNWDLTDFDTDRFWAIVEDHQR